MPSAEPQRHRHRSWIPPQDFVPDVLVEDVCGLDGATRFTLREKDRVQPKEAYEAEIKRENGRRDCPTRVGKFRFRRFAADLACTLASCAALNSSAVDYRSAPRQQIDLELAAAGA